MAARRAAVHGAPVVALSDCRRGIRYALASGPTPLDKWRENPRCGEFTPDGSASVASKQWSTVWASGAPEAAALTKRQQGLYAPYRQQGVLVLSAYIAADNQIYGYDAALDLEATVISHLLTHYPEPAVVLSRPGHPDDGKTCGGGRLVVDSILARTMQPVETGDKIVALLLMTTVALSFRHSYVGA